MGLDSIIKLISSKYSYLILGCLILIFVLFKYCNKPIESVKIPTQDKAKVIADQKKDKEETNEVKKKDSIRTIVLIKWKTIRKDSLIPCETKIEFADTIIMADSALIYAQKALLQIKDTTIKDLFTIVKTDSIRFDSVCKVTAKLNKRLKRSKTLAKVAFGVGLVSGGFVGTKLN